MSSAAFRRKIIAKQENARDRRQLPVSEHNFPTCSLSLIYSIQNVVIYKPQQCDVKTLNFTLAVLATCVTTGYLVSVCGYYRIYVVNIVL